MGGMPPSPDAALPRDTPLPPQVVGLAYRRATEHLHELDTATLAVAGGDTVELCCVSEVRAWLTGLAARAEGGEPL